MGAQRWRVYLLQSVRKEMRGHCLSWIRSCLSMGFWREFTFLGEYSASVSNPQSTHGRSHLRQGIHGKIGLPTIDWSLFKKAWVSPTLFSERAHDGLRNDSKCDISRADAPQHSPTSHHFCGTYDWRIKRKVTYIFQLSAILCRKRGPDASVVYSSSQLSLVMYFDVLPGENLKRVCEYQWKARGAH